MEEIRESHKPISPWGYIGYEILYAIPVVGLVLAIIFAITSKNKNVKNFAKAQLIMVVIAVVLVLIMFGLGMMGGKSPEEIRALFEQAMAK